MPFGLRITPSFFQRFMNIIFNSSIDKSSLECAIRTLYCFKLVWKILYKKEILHSCFIKFYTFMLLLVLRSLPASWKIIFHSCHENVFTEVCHSGMTFFPAALCKRSYTAVIENSRLKYAVWSWDYSQLFSAFHEHNF